MDHFGEYIDDSEYEGFENDYNSEMEERKMKKSPKKSSEIINDFDFTKDFNKVVGTKTKKDSFGDITW